MGQGKHFKDGIDQPDNVNQDAVEEDRFPRKEKKYKQSETVTVVSRVNRSKNFPIGRGFYTFGPFESKDIPRSALDHPDFKQQANDFIVKEK